MPSLVRFFAAGALLGLVTGGAAYARSALAVESAPWLPGVRVDGETVPEGSDLRAFVEQRAHALKDRRVKLVVAGDGRTQTLLETTLGDLGVDVDVDQVVGIVRSVGRDTDLLDAYETSGRARAGEIDVPLVVTADMSSVLPRLEAFKEEMDTAPVSARLDLDHHGVVPEKDGQYLDPYGTMAAIEEAAGARGYANDPEVKTIVIPTRSFKPRISSDYLKSIDITHVVSQFETPFSRAQVNRSRNIEVAMSRVNGVVLWPGATMSFNEAVGARTVENGFQHAGEIFKGEMVDGVGGGTCQAASTLHAAAFFAGLDIIERLPHSRPSAYVEIGLDATVVYPSVDLKLRNPFEFPVVVHAFVDGNKAKVELLGAHKPVSVTFGKSFLASFPFSRKVTEEAWVTKPVLKQKGMKGVQIRRVRTLRYENGQERVETTVDTYPPVMEVYKVPPGFDQEELPAVGEDENASATPTTKPGEEKKNDSREGAPLPAERHG